MIMASKNIAKTATAMEDYITVVEVDDTRTPQNMNSKNTQQPLNRQSSVQEDSSYITVLTINNGLSTSENITHDKESSKDNNQDEKSGIMISEHKSESDKTEVVIVFRLPGERLGFGLKFQGGTRNTEKVNKLYIQSCAKDSPASKVLASWGALREGDEIVGIDERPVNDMTRIDCVRCLKDNVAIRLEVRNGHGQKPDTKEDFIEQNFLNEINGIIHTNSVNGYDNSSKMSNGQLKLGQPPPPPPVPPRKLVKRKSLKEKLPIIINGSKTDNSNTIDKPFTPPPDAEYYINLFADAQSVRAESESDDTASTISTVIDKFSINSNYSSDSDLSSFTSLSTNVPNVQINNNPDLVKVLKPFTMLEQEFKVNNKNIKHLSNKPITGNNYENVEFKTEKINTYENYDFNSQSPQHKSELNTVDKEGPKPKPRHVLSNNNNEQISYKDNTTNSTTPTTTKFSGKSINLPTNSFSNASTDVVLDVKKRSILPMPRQYGSPAKVLIEVVPPKVPDSTDNLKTSKNIPQSPAEFMTKIPKAIPSPGNLQILKERAKTESDIKLRANNNNNNIDTTNKTIATTIFLEQEHKAHNYDNKHLANNKQIITLPKTTSPFNKSRIPVVLSPKRSLEGVKIIERNLNGTPSNGQNFSNIPRIVMQKQKSETDLKLGLYRSKSSKESSPVSKLPLQRTISVESKLKSPERTLTHIPILSSAMSSSTESIQSVQSITSKSAKGPKPKPPERVQSLPKTQIPKLNLINTSTAVAVTINGDRNVVSPNNKMPTLQTFRQSPPSNAETFPAPIKNSEIRFKIQTYESKAQQEQQQQQQQQQNNDMLFESNNLPDSVENNNLPSLYDFVRNKNIPIEKSKTNEEHYGANNREKPILIVTENEEIGTNRDTASRQLPLIVGKCFKVTENQQTYYSSSSSEGECDDNVDDGDECDDDNEDDNEKDYICEDGEKLGPPEVINGPGPSEAYFNLYWHSNVLPTIGEVEEECSSLELQHLSSG